MSQHDLDIANQGFPATRADINNALQALGSSNSGATAPSTTYANQLWYDTANNIIKIRNEDNDAWISLFTLDQTNDNIEALTIDGSLTVDGGTIKLDGNYPTGTGNVALGDAALDDGSLSGGFNTAIGNAALGANTTGQQNVAVGQNAADAVTTGNSNVAVGAHALGQTTTGSNNTAVGQNALTANTTASSNTAMGHNCLTANTTGTNNACFGRDAGERVTTGSQNTLIGDNAGENITTPDNNTFIGRSAGSLITSGANNTIIGRYNGNQGGLDIRTSSNQIVLSDGDGNPRVHIHEQGRVHATMTGADKVLLLENTNTSNPDGLDLFFSGTDPDNNSRYFVRGRDTSLFRFYIYSDGDVQNHDNSYGATSDTKLKQQVTDASSQWDDIKALQIRKFKFNSDVEEYGDSNNLWRLGVIAQEVETAGMTGLVKNNPDIGENGEDLGTVTKSVKYSILYMKAVKALQEAMTRIETLETKVAALEAE